MAWSSTTRTGCCFQVDDDRCRYPDPSFLQAQGSYVNRNAGKVRVRGFLFDVLEDAFDSRSLGKLGIDELVELLEDLLVFQSNRGLPYALLLLMVGGLAGTLAGAVGLASDRAAARRVFTLLSQHGGAERRGDQNAPNPGSLTDCINMALRTP